MNGGPGTHVRKPPKADMQPARQCRHLSSLSASCNVPARADGGAEGSRPGPGDPLAGRCDWRRVTGLRAQGCVINSCVTLRFAFSWTQCCFSPEQHLGIQRLPMHLI